MRIFVYADRPSDGARALVEALRELGQEAFRLRADSGYRLRADDVVVNWGEAATAFVPARTLNLNVLKYHGKLRELQRMNELGVRTVDFVLPGQTVTATVPIRWLGRTNNHQGGHDLLQPPTFPHYYTRRENFTREFRVHIFDGVSIRAGMKVPREGFPEPHEWIRSYDAGWRISYRQGGEYMRQAYRDLAKDAIKALELDFGAVDIGVRADGTAMVLEVNRAPGIEGGSIGVYASRIVGWANGQGGVVAIPEVAVPAVPAVEAPARVRDEELVQVVPHPAQHLPVRQVEPPVQLPVAIPVRVQPNLWNAERIERQLEEIRRGPRVATPRVAPVNVPCPHCAGTGRVAAEDLPGVQRPIHLERG